MPKIVYERQLSYLSSLRNPPDALLREMEELAAEKKIPILDWKAAELLEQLILIHRPKRVLEIGTAIAYSSIRIARHLFKKGILDTIEKSKDNIVLAAEFIKRAKLNSAINILEGDALKMMPVLEKKYDFIFLDADKEDYEKLFYYSLTLLKRGGVIFIDNLLWHGYAAAKTVPTAYSRSAKIIRDFNTLFTNQSLLKTTILPIGDGIGLGVKI
ncbi:O-methyltransferase [bacterium]|nr:O-methyltransferase [bacterium]